jgi:hypothetical protein
MRIWKTAGAIGRSGSSGFATAQHYIGYPIYPQPDTLSDVQVYSGAIAGSAPVMIHDDQFRFEVDRIHLGEGGPVSPKPSRIHRGDVGPVSPKPISIHLGEGGRKVLTALVLASWNGSRFQSRNVQTRFQESRCSRVFSGCHVFGSTRRSNVCPPGGLS